MFTNKLNAKGEKNVHTHKKKKKTSCTIIESMNIALIVHFTPQTLREARGRGHVVSSSEMARGKKKSR